MNTLEEYEGDVSRYTRFRVVDGVGFKCTVCCTDLPATEFEGKGNYHCYFCRTAIHYTCYHKSTFRCDDDKERYPCQRCVDEASEDD
jgi:hypothetical protein